MGNFVDHLVLTTTATREFVIYMDTAFLMKKIVYVISMAVEKKNAEINVYRVIIWWEFVMLKDNVNTISNASYVVYLCLLLCYYLSNNTVEFYFLNIYNYIYT